MILEDGIFLMETGTGQQSIDFKFYLNIVLKDRI